ncbi:MAG: hypothetical protein FD166_3621 [Bacteroidetes bacterium]|nr:MAG: hypothetical protein FD166_3621 [Bacteroidota bacterium]
MTIIPHPDILPGVYYPDKKKILKEVASSYDLPVESLYEHTRKRTISEPRMITLTICKYALSLTNDDLGFEFMITAASVVHARKTVRNLYLTDKAFKAKLDSILVRLFIWDSDRIRIIGQILNPQMDKTKFKYWKKRRQQPINN